MTARASRRWSKLLKSRRRSRSSQAADGQAAYDKFKSEKPDLVILEAILPKIHGFDLTKKISQESGGRVPVIIVTGLYRGPQYKHEALSSFGAADYFEKPVDPEKFVASVIQLLHDEEDIEEELPDSGFRHRGPIPEDQGQARSVQGQDGSGKGRVRLSPPREGR